MPIENLEDHYPNLITKGDRLLKNIERVKRVRKLFRDSEIEEIHKCEKLIRELEQELFEYREWQQR